MLFRAALQAQIHPHVALSIDNDTTLRDICVVLDVFGR
jgi:hypothetical protein